MNPIINLSQRDGEVWLLPVMSAWAAQKAPLLSMEEGQDVLGGSVEGGGFSGNKEKT